jgi:hypothetical protein
MLRAFFARCVSVEICGQRIFEVAGDPTGRIYDIRDAPDGLLLGADNGLFRCDGKRTIHVAGEWGEFSLDKDTPDGLLAKRNRPFSAPSSSPDMK